MNNSNEQPTNTLTAVEIQQQYFENLPDCDWVKYDTSKRKHLMQNVAFALFGCPSREGDLEDDCLDALEGYNTRQKEQAINVYKKICQQSKYSLNDDILLSILLIVCVRSKPVHFFKFKPSDHWLNLHEKTDVIIWCTPVFKIRKCIPTVVHSKPCRVYIDEQARVYEDWASYLSENTLPQCVIVAPQDGEYQGMIIEETENFTVKLTVTASPALGFKAVVLNKADTASTVASVGALGVLGVAAFTPVAPVLLVGAAVATVTTGVYGLFRSSTHIYDRRIHQQSISLSDAEARGSWVNIAASSAGLGAGAASSLLARSAAAGTNLTKTGKVIAATFKVLNGATLVTGGVGVLHGLVHLIVKYNKHGEKPTRLELFQFTASVLFFCQGAMSNRTAKNIIEDAQANTINEYRATLRSNKHKKIFDKISAETRRVDGHVQGNTEVILGIKNIANKDQYFADVLRINKDINKHKMRISMTADGQVNLNGAHRFDPSELSGLGKDGRAQLFSTLGPSKSKAANVSTKLVPSTGLVPRAGGKEEESLTVTIRPEEVLRIGAHLVRLSTTSAEQIATYLEKLSREVYDFFMKVVFNIVAHLLPEDIANLKLLSPDEDLILQIVKFVFNFLKNILPPESRETDNWIKIALTALFMNGVISKETILYLKDRLLKWASEQLRKLSEQHPNRYPIYCNVCSGVRYS